MKFSILAISFKRWIFFALTAMAFSPAFAQEPAFKGKIGTTYSESKEYWPEKISAPANAPNIIWILLDDVGFGATSAFGGLIHTPTFDSLANQGLRYTNFHTVGICSPTRAALLTGTNHHDAHMGKFPHGFLSAGFPGYDAKIPSSKGTIAEVLRERGYSTYALGKWHLTPDAEISDFGPFDRWPSGKGFDHFYGFLGGATDQYKPKLVEDNKNIGSDGRHLNELLIDKAIEYTSNQKKFAPAKPFFLYLATGAGHSPHQVDTSWSNKYKGQFDEGWDVYREKVLANQKKLQVIPQDARLPERNADVKAWDALSKEEQKVYARFFEVYAGFLEYTDFEIGRLINHLKASGQLDNTAIFIVVGDNGGSKEGTAHGSVKGYELTDRSAITEDEYIKSVEADYSLIGSPQGYTNYPIGWAQATNTPFKLWKQDVSAEGASHLPLIVFYPKGIKEKGGIRNQYSHVIDLFPTTTELIGVTAPAYIRGIKQDAVKGSSIFPSFNNTGFVSKHTVQYYELFGSRSIYKNGWKASALHTPGFRDVYELYKDKKIKLNRDYSKDKWELYHIEKDFNELIDLSAKYPEKLKELKATFDSEAKKNHVYPLTDWVDGYEKQKNDTLYKK